MKSITLNGYLEPEINLVQALGGTVTKKYIGRGSNEVGSFPCFETTLEIPELVFGNKVLIVDINCQIPEKLDSIPLKEYMATHSITRIVQKPTYRTEYEVIQDFEAETGITGQYVSAAFGAAGYSNGWGYRYYINGISHNETLGLNPTIQ